MSRMACHPVLAVCRRSPGRSCLQSKKQASAKAARRTGGPRPGPTAQQALKKTAWTSKNRNIGNTAPECAVKVDQHARLTFGGIDTAVPVDESSRVLSQHTGKSQSRTGSRQTAEGQIMDPQVNKQRTQKHTEKQLEAQQHVTKDLRNFEKLLELPFPRQNGDVTLLGFIFPRSQSSSSLSSSLPTHSTSLRSCSLSATKSTTASQSAAC
jgi:hypothetical protein